MRSVTEGRRSGSQGDRRWVARAGLLENMVLRQKHLQEVSGSHEEEWRRRFSARETTMPTTRQENAWPVKESRGLGSSEGGTGSGG